MGLPSIHYIAGRATPTVIGILTSLAVIQPLVRRLMVTGFIVNSFGDLIDIRLRSEWSITANELVALFVFVMVNVVVTFMAGILVQKMCGCSECECETYHRVDILEVCWDYVKFPFRYVLDIPMHVYDDGQMVWGRRHAYSRRGDRPTVISGTGAEEWRKGIGQLDRSGDKPAYISPVTGHMMWYRNGVLDREYGPASVWDSGVVYYSNGMVHRSNDEPAIFGVSYVEWWIHGVNRRDDTEYPSRIEVRGESYKYYFTDDTGTEIEPTVVKL